MAVWSRAGVLAVLLVACAGRSQGARAQNDASVPPAEEPQGEAAAVEDATPEAAVPKERAGHELASPAPERSEAKPADTKSQSKPKPDETPAAPKPTRMLSDPAIGSVVILIHEGEIEQAELAKKKSQDPQVIQFADLMITEHRQGLEQHTALSRHLGLRAEESTLSKQLKRDMAASTSALKKADQNFDRAYIDGAVEAHAKVLNAIDSELLPSATNLELKSELERLKTVVEKHLAHGRSVQQNLAAAGSPEKKSK